MNELTLVCKDERRRQRVCEKQGLNGLDYLEVSEDQRQLTVYFLRKAPEEWRDKELHNTLRHLRIEGGRRIRDIQIIDLTIHREEDPELDDCLVVTVDRPGDFSTYKFCVVAVDEDGRQTDRPYPGFDPRYACLDFSFKAGCPSDLDCKPQPLCPPEKRDEPEINYLAKDYASFRQLILDRLALIMPDWKERHVPDLGIALVEVLAYVGDHLSYYQDAVATEAYLDTARQRISVRRHARLVDYTLHEGSNARAWVTLWVSQQYLPLIPDDFYLITDPGIAASGTIHDHTELPRTLPRPYLVFEPLVEDRKTKIKLYEDHNEIGIYSWGDEQCCIPKGATSTTLIDPGTAPTTEPEEPEYCEEPEGYVKGTVKRQKSKEQSYAPSLDTGHTLQLHECDVVIFEEVKGPKTGNPADADPSHRHAVRLTKVTRSMDPLTQKLIVEIEWAEEDALPFPVCVSSIKEEDCTLISDVSVVRGNVVLVDHGERVEDDLGQVPTETLLPDCGDECSPREVLKVAGWYRPALPQLEVIFSQPLLPCVPTSKTCTPASKLTPATAWLKQDVRFAFPEVTLYGLPDELQPTQQTWEPRRDLLASGPTDRHFAVEMDNERRAHLRFGDGELGRMPDAGTRFQAVYRVGNGASGNVGAETISHIVFRNRLPQGAGIRPRNPFPAIGGTAPEPLAEAKLFAPHVFRKELQRAITAGDYAHIVMRDFKHKVQRAAARLRWTGSWYEVLVAIDPLGSVEADEELLCEIAGHLYRYRRIGHDVVVRPAHYVPLDIAMIVCVLPNYLRGHVKAALLEIFSNRLLPDGRLGFFHPDNLSFGDGIYLSKLIAAAQAVIGVESVSVTKLERLFEGPNGEIESGVLLLGPFEIVRLDNDPSFPENGMLTLDVRGGR